MTNAVFAKTLEELSSESNTCCRN